MASLPPPTITPFSSTFPSQSQLPLYDHLKPTNFLINRKCKNIVLHRVSRNDSNSDQNTTTLIDPHIRATSPRNLDRRNLLLGLIGSLYGAAMNIGSDDPLALAASIVTPDTSKPIVANAAEMPLITTSSHDFPIILDKVVRLRVKRPKTSRSKKEKEEEEEVVVVDGIEFDRNEYVKFDVLVNEEDEGASRPDKTELAGSFSNVPQIKSKNNGKKTRTCLRLGIGELLEDLEAEDDESLLVTLVPRAGIGLLSIGGVKIELEYS